MASIQKEDLKTVEYYLDNASSSWGFRDGTCFKDYAALKSGKGVCYISEYGLEAIENGEPLEDHVETRESLLNLINEYKSKISVEELFESLDWQYASTFLEEYSDWSEAE